MEFETQARDLDTILVAVGGGGLIGWNSRVVRATSADCRCRAVYGPDADRGAEGRTSGGRASLVESRSILWRRVVSAIWYSRSFSRISIESSS